jgi:HPt (histidine-containing phosphotransfer) domain-containing protein
LTRRPSPSADDLALLDPDGSFRERLLTDLAALERLRTNGSIAEMQPIVHRLAGAAGTFGYAEIGELAIALDDLFVEGPAVAISDIDRLLQALRASTRTSA